MTENRRMVSRGWGVSMKGAQQRELWNKQCNVQLDRWNAFSYDFNSECISKPISEHNLFFSGLTILDKKLVFRKLIDYKLIVYFFIFFNISVSRRHIKIIILFFTDADIFLTFDSPSPTEHLMQTISQPTPYFIQTLA